MTDPSIRILSWNVNGIRARIRKKELHFLTSSNSDSDSNSDYNYDIVCFQETKATPEQVKLNKELTTKYPYRYWQSNKGTTQKKGFSGTCIWSKTKPIKEVTPPKIDEEGRITALEFPNFFIVSVYTPNSGSSDDKTRYIYRTTLWHATFIEFLTTLKTQKPTIVCGDLNVCHKEIDIHNPKKNKNKIAGFLDIEREQFQFYLEYGGFIDVFRSLNPTLKHQYTWWSPFGKAKENNKGWRLDYFLLGNHLNENSENDEGDEGDEGDENDEGDEGDENDEGDEEVIEVENCQILSNIKGSDHCPIDLKFIIN